MNINPFSITPPQYDSYEDFYKFFEVYPKEVENGVLFIVFPPVQIPKEKQVIFQKEEDNKEL